MIFVDTWAWLALAVERDQYHQAARKEHVRLQQQRRPYITTNFVVSELVTQLYRQQAATDAERFVLALFEAADRGAYQLVHISPDQFRRAWQLRRKYHDKPGISFVDITSMVVMRDLKIVEVFTGDRHFEQVGLGFQLRP